MIENNYWHLIIIEIMLHKCLQKLVISSKLLLIKVEDSNKYINDV